MKGEKEEREKRERESSLNGGRLNDSLLAVLSSTSVVSSVRLLLTHSLIHLFVCVCTSSSPLSPISGHTDYWALPPSFPPLGQVMSTNGHNGVNGGGGGGGGGGGVYASMGQFNTVDPNNALSIKWDPKNLEIRTHSVEKTLEPLVMQVGSAASG